MAKIQCKMCGGLLELPENAQSGTCEYCGSRVTFPKITSEQQEKLYDRSDESAPASPCGLSPSPRLRRTSHRGKQVR